jgi:uncharacterized protein
MNRLHDLGSLNAFQSSFAARIRNPQGEPLPAGIPERRMRVYEELLFNNLEGFLLACYPITHQLLGKEWKRTVRLFITEHHCKSPLFRAIPLEFLEWMEDQAAKRFPAMPFLCEFMHYEWLEMAISIFPEEADSGLIDSRGDLLSGRPVLNPASELVCYHYPVHQISPGFQPRQADGRVYCYLLYRNTQDQVQFMALNPASARLVELLQDQEITGREALLRLASEINHHDPETIIEAGLGQLESLRDHGVLLGTRINS